MPKLRAAFKSGGKPNLWFCSLCGGQSGLFFESSAAADSERIADLNAQFRKHCEEAHPAAHIEGLKHGLTIVPASE